MVDFKNGKIICDNGLVIDKHLHLADLLAAAWEEGQFFSRPSYYSGLTHIELHNVTSADGIEVLSFEIPKNGKITGYSIYPTDCFPATFPEYDERKIIRKKMEEWLLQHQKSAESTKYPWGSVRIVDDQISGMLHIAIAFSSIRTRYVRAKHKLRVLFPRFFRSQKKRRP